MEIDWSVWGLPLAVFAAGLVMSGLILGLMRFGSADPVIRRDSRRIDLESTRDEAVEGLKQLELDRDKMDPDEYAREREHLLSRGARALEALDTTVPITHLPTGQASVQGASAASARPQGGISPEWKGALYALGAVGLLGVLWTLATQDTVERRDGASMTGNQALGGAPEGGNPRAAIQESPKFKQRIAELEAKLAADPNDLEALNDLTQTYMMVSDYQKAFGYNDTALKAAPSDPDARTYRGALTAMMSMPEKALEQFDAVLAEKPDHALAIVYRAMVLFQTGQVDAALTSLETAAKKYPDSEEIQSAWQQARAAAAEQGATPSAAPPGGAPEMASGDVIVSGTLTLDPASAAALTGSETLFLSVADPARPRPPLAAQKLPGPLQFPMPFQITTSSLIAMGGTPPAVPGAIDLKARIDLDGDAKTQESAPSATITGVSRGAGGLALTLTLAGTPTAAPAGSPSLLAPLAPAPGAPLGGPLGGGPPAPGTPPGTTDVGGAPVAGAPVATSEVLAAGVAALDPGAGALAGSEVVFVSVRDPAGGPPLASKKVPARFPLEFSITSADIIAMGAARPIPATFNVSVRVDRDGNAMSKDGEPEAVLTGVKKGSAQLQLTLH